MKILFKSLVLVAAVSAIFLAGCHCKKVLHPVDVSSCPAVKQTVKQPVQKPVVVVHKYKKVTHKQKMHLYTK